MGLRGRTRLLEYRLFFVTTTCHDFIQLIEPAAVKEILIDNLNFYCRKYNARIVAYALMPEHLHLMIYFSEENKLSEYMRDFKKYTSLLISRYWMQQPPCYNNTSQRKAAGNKTIWMDRFDDLYLYSRKVCWIKLNYINRNPVKRGLCNGPGEYQFSSGAFYEGNPHVKIPLLHLSELL
jgi:putative transposase